MREVQLVFLDVAIPTRCRVVRAASVCLIREAAQVRLLLVDRDLGVPLCARLEPRDAAEAGRRPRRDDFAFSREVELELRALPTNSRLARCEVKGSSRILLVHLRVWWERAGCVSGFNEKLYCAPRERAFGPTWYPSDFRLPLTWREKREK